MSDEELDRLFKEAAEGYIPKEDSSAWADMSARLDGVGRTPSFWNWKTITMSAVIGLTGITVLMYSYFYRSDAVDVKSQVNSLSESRLDEREDVKMPSAEVSANQFEPSETKAARITEIETSQRLGSEKAQSNSHKPLRKLGIENNDTGKFQSGGNKTDRSEINNQKQNIENTTLNVNNNKNARQIANSGHKETAAIAVSPISDEVPSDRSSELKLVDSLVRDRKLDVVNNTYFKGTPLIDSLSTTLTLIPPVDSISATTKKTSEKEPAFIRSISVKLSVSPDFSSIKMFSPYKPGINYGILVGYNFNKRWSVFAGAISSKKIYSSTEIDEPYTSSGGYDYPVEQLDGDCRVLDIPINAYYTFHTGHSFSIRAGFGLSSYLMLSEDYTYYLDKPYGSNVYTQSVDRENNEWFKIANLSIAIQKTLNEKLYLEVEPFMKIPLAGIGEGDVSLVTLGAFINLRFDFYLKTKK